MKMRCTAKKYFTSQIKISVEWPFSVVVVVVVIDVVAVVAVMQLRVSHFAELPSNFNCEM